MILKLIQSITGIYELTWSEILLGISLAVVVYFALVIILAF